MEIFNIGPLELLLIVAIALIVLGPEEMVRTLRKLAKWVNKIIKSPIWKSLLETSQEIKELPQKFIKEAELDETMAELNKMNQQIRDFAKANPLDLPNNPMGDKTEMVSKDRQSGHTSDTQLFDPNLVTEKLDKVEKTIKNERVESEKLENFLENSPKA